MVVGWECRVVPVGPILVAALGHPPRDCQGDYRTIVVASIEGKIDRWRVELTPARDTPDVRRRGAASVDYLLPDAAAPAISWLLSGRIIFAADGHDPAEIAHWLSLPLLAAGRDACWRGVLPVDELREGIFPTAAKHGRSLGLSDDELAVLLRSDVGTAEADAVRAVASVRQALTAVAEAKREQSGAR